MLKRLVRIGHLSIDRKHMLQLPDIQWVSLDIDLQAYLVKVTIEKRRQLYESLHDSFLEIASIIPGWERVISRQKMPYTFFEILLAFIVLKAEPLLSQTECLHRSIDFCKKFMEGKKLRAVFSQGAWFRFVAQLKFGCPGTRSGKS